MPIIVNNSGMKWYVAFLIVVVLVVFCYSEGDFSSALPCGGEYARYAKDVGEPFCRILGETMGVTTEKCNGDGVQSVTYKGDNRPKKEDIAKIFRAIDVKTESGEGYLITYYYTPKLKLNPFSGSFFNLQIIETAEKTVVSDGIYPASF